MASLMPDDTPRRNDDDAVPGGREDSLGGGDASRTQPTVDDGTHNDLVYDRRADTDADHYGRAYADPDDNPYSDGNTYTYPDPDPDTDTDTDTDGGTDTDSATDTDGGTDTDSATDTDGDAYNDSDPTDTNEDDVDQDARPGSDGADRLRAAEWDRYYATYFVPVLPQIEEAAASQRDAVAAAGPFAYVRLGAIGDAAVSETQLVLLRMDIALEGALVAMLSAALARYRGAGPLGAALAGFGDGEGDGLRTARDDLLRMLVEQSAELRALIAETGTDPRPGMRPAPGPDAADAVELLARLQRLSARMWGALTDVVSLSVADGDGDDVGAVASTVAVDSTDAADDEDETRVFQPEEIPPEEEETTPPPGDGGLAGLVGAAWSEREDLARRAWSLLASVRDG